MPNANDAFISIGDVVLSGSSEDGRSQPMVMVLSGISGSGKSTYARRLQKQVPDSVICSADHYFLNEDNQYVFDRTKLGEAHASCFRAFKAAMAAGAPLVIVDNTNTSAREIKGYANLAAEFGYQLQVTNLVCDVETAIGRNTHNVPAEVIRSQMERMQKRDDSQWGAAVLTIQQTPEEDEDSGE